MRVKKGLFVVDRKGRIGVIVRPYAGAKPKNHEVQFGADGPIEVVPQYKLRQATEEEIRRATGEA